MRISNVMFAASLIAGLGTHNLAAAAQSSAPTCCRAWSPSSMRTSAQWRSRSRGRWRGYNETDGGHTWINWRRYLADFLPRLF